MQTISFGYRKRYQNDCSMTFKTYFIITLAFFSFSGFANTVSPDTAQLIAQNFYTLNTGSAHTANLHMTKTEGDGSADFYVFDISPVGFVIVSATDNVTPILAYSTESNFQSGNAQVGISEWMQNTGAGVHQAVLQHVPASTKTTLLWTSYLQGQSNVISRSAGVKPMLSTTWSQDPYYNVLCPYDNEHGGRSVTGCVATTMAQIMKYWSFPSQGVGSFSYVDSQGVNGCSYNIGRLSADFGATKYDWANMPASLGSTDQTVATLLYHCGVGVGMNYSANGSSAVFNHPGHPCAVNAFTSYFSYDAQTIRYVAKAAYTSADWLTLIENELNQGRPVFYTGQDTGNIGGHAWVCDGYDASGNLHMNWGWGGTDNGYFSITDLDAAPYNFSWSQSAIIGIQPDPAVLALSVKDVASDINVSLFPNPAKDKINITGDNTGTSDYTIFDAMGRKIFNGTMTGDAHSVDVSSLMTGVYFLNLQNGTQSSTRKFVVEK